MAPKTKTRAANTPVPQTREEAAQFIHEIGMQQRQLARIEADMNDAIADAKKRAETESLGLRDAIDALTQGLKTWAEANRAALTEGKRKYADLGTGRLEWRFTPARVTIRNVDEVVARIRTLGLGALFLREKAEINKEAMLADAEKARGIVGVSIGAEGERFYVEPFESEIQGAE